MEFRQTSFQAWKVMEFRQTSFQAWKVFENSKGPRKSWKIEQCHAFFNYGILKLQGKII